MENSSISDIETIRVDTPNSDINIEGSSTHLKFLWSYLQLIQRL